MNTKVIKRNSMRYRSAMFLSGGGPLPRTNCGLNMMHGWLILFTTAVGTIISLALVNTIILGLGCIGLVNLAALGEITIALGMVIPVGVLILLTGWMFVTLKNKCSAYVKDKWHGNSICKIIEFED